MANENRTGEVVSLALIAGSDGAVRDVEFVDCQVNGPALIVPRDSEFTDCGWDTNDVEALLWEIAPSRTIVIGPVLVERCRFLACRFTRVGIAGPAAAITQWRESLAP
jgi:hypothetical protein